MSVLSNRHALFEGNQEPRPFPAAAQEREERRMDEFSKETEISIIPEGNGGLLCFLVCTYTWGPRRLERKGGVEGEGRR